jgi:hypothetical protein
MSGFINGCDKSNGAARGAVFFSRSFRASLWYRKMNATIAAMTSTAPTDISAMPACEREFEFGAAGEGVGDGEGVVVRVVVGEDIGEDVEEDVGAVVEEDALVEVALVEELDILPKSQRATLPVSCHSTSHCHAHNTRSHHYTASSPYCQRDSRPSISPHLYE